MSGGKIRQFTSASNLIDAIGVERFRRLTGASPQSVSNYRAANRLPPKTYVLCQTELKRLRATAPASLWDMLEPAEKVPA